ncbi:hypothetical protein [Pedococcus sp. 5OH_020]|uniref:hypothetical protein n=1 Tax=Pedococcus sp. 5OH_020 TaxID=2989814 RepID=UPI0022E9C664|nr:hypothetical protein [Pedococcus sp. 5OH_020]
MSDRQGALEQFYALLDDLSERIGGPKHLNSPNLAALAPHAGLYFFFEPGEQRPNGNPRVVRVGTHALTGTSGSSLWGRLRQHRGVLGGSNPGGGNHRGSIFRHHVGAALLNRRGDADLLRSWLGPKPSPDLRDRERVLEVEVSRRICAMPFLWLAVPNRADHTSDRGLLERNTIALLSALTGSPEGPHDAWLGLHAVAPKVRAAGLWNVNHVDDPFQEDALDLLAAYVKR